MGNDDQPPTCNNTTGMLVCVEGPGRAWAGVRVARRRPHRSQILLELARQACRSPKRVMLHACSPSLVPYRPTCMMLTVLLDLCRVTGFLPPFDGGPLTSRPSFSLFSLALRSSSGPCCDASASLLSVFIMCTLAMPFCQMHAYHEKK